jgi:hypothetical protein
MKKIRFVLVSLALLSMGMASCVTTSTPKLDLSSIDSTQPVPVVGILMRTPSGSYQDQFFQKYGYDDLEKWNNDPEKLEQLLDMLCGTVSRNWTTITAKVKTETGLTLNGDEFLMHLQDGNTNKLRTEKSKRPLDDKGYFFTWQGIGVDSEYGAAINLIVRAGGKIEVFDVDLHKFDVLGSTESQTKLVTF